MHTRDIIQARAKQKLIKIVGVELTRISNEKGFTGRRPRTRRVALLSKVLAERLTENRRFVRIVSRLVRIRSRDE